VSAAPGGAYRLMSGSSMAAGHVTGACALIRALSPDITVAAMKARIMNSVDPIPSMNGIVASNGRLNLHSAITWIDPPLDPPGSVGHTLRASVDGTDLVLTWQEPVVDADHGPPDHYHVLRAANPWAPFESVAVVLSFTTHIEPLSATKGDAFYRVVAANAAGESE
jgi:subtilisin family serine protease